MKSSVYTCPCCGRQHIPQNIPPGRIEQATGAIKQGQSQVDFMLHCHPDNRSVARKAYNAAEWILECTTQEMPKP